MVNAIKATLANNNGKSDLTIKTPDDSAYLKSARRGYVHVSGDIEAEAEQLQYQLDAIVDDRQWVITMARNKKITEEDMEMQLAAMEFQALDLRKKQEKKLAALLVQQRGEYLREWAKNYLGKVANGVRVLQTDITQLNEEEQENLYEGLEASRFEDKYNGDTSAALQWSIFEEKRRIVRMLVEIVLVIKGESNEKAIKPIPALDIPTEFVDLVYNDQSLDVRPTWLEKYLAGN